MEKLPLAEYLAKPEYGLSHLPGVILVSYFGSMAIGTNHEDSDVDLRGIYMGSPENLLCQVDEKSWDHHDPDITMYTLHYAMSMLARCNPSMLELLYTRPEDRICYGQLGDMLVRNRHLFLSAQAVGAYMGYCTSQLHKLENALARDQADEARREEHLCQLLERVRQKFVGRYRGFTDGELRLYVDTSSKAKYEREIFIDLSLKHYPVRDLKSSIADFNDVLAQFDGGNPGNRNHKKDDKHICKHASHLVRLLMEGRDLLLNGEFCTFRTTEKDVLLDILHGKFLKPNGLWDMDGFRKVLDEYRNQVNEAAKHTVLPEKPDYDRLHKLEAEMTSLYLSEAKL